MSERIPLRSTKIIECVYVSPASKRANLVTKKDFKRKLTKACLNLELIAGKELYSGEGSLLTNILCRNCADKNETVTRKILATVAQKSNFSQLW